MKATILPGYPLSGQASPPGDKSISHRAALFAALANGESTVENFLVSGVTRAMLNALTTLGVDWSLDGGTLRVRGCGLQGLSRPNQALDCGNSATTLRLLAGALAAAGVAAELDGSPGLRSRPMDRILDPLRRMGAEIEAAGGGKPPLRLKARPAGRLLRGMAYEMPVASAQVKTCLLLAGLAADRNLVLHEAGFSRNHTERMLAYMGAEISTDLREAAPGPSITLKPLKASLRPIHATAPGDFSSAAFLIVAALITPGSKIAIQGVDLNPTRTGLLEALLAMDAQIEIQNQGNQAGEPVGNLLVSYSRLKGTEIGGEMVPRMIDEFPALAVAGSYAQGTTLVRDAIELRYKESDRIAALCSELRALGAGVQERPDGFVIEGKSELAGGTANPHRDHRLAMALSVAGLASRGPVVVEGADIVQESYPQFYEVMKRLGAKIQREENPYAG